MAELIRKQNGEIQVWVYKTLPDDLDICIRNHYEVCTTTFDLRRLDQLIMMLSEIQEEVKTWPMYQEYLQRNF